MMANVQIGNANACMRNVSRSSASALGRRQPSPYGKRRLPPSYPSRTRCSAAPRKPTSRMPDATEAAVTWMSSQYEFSAGTSGPAGAYSTMPSRPSSRATASAAKSPRWRRFGRRTTTASQTVMPTNDPASTNSYMLPHGTRCAAKPRVTSVATWNASPATVSTTPASPTRAGTSEGEGAGGGSAAGPAPAATSSRAGATDGRTPNAYSTAYASIANTYSRIVTTSS